ncbi:MAG TPA: hypothetical protein VJ810_41030 [Blastocatellia bacterium]|nr:hypothetical protein [Blastocatellia bacterium]
MRTTRLNTPAIWLTALSLSIGWGIRGNFGHEFGAMVPGALAAMAVALLSGREDWRKRIAYFAMFGALGWSFGGSISYMQVIAYTHSGHSLSVIYGFASLFVIGFLWAAMGGAGTALPAAIDRKQMAEFFPPLIAVFIAWVLQEILENTIFAVDSQYRQQSPLYWYDSDWLAALTAIGAILILAAIRRRFDRASSLILHMAVGWWVGFALLVLVLGWRMTPPRGDNWAGCAGMVAGMLFYFQRHKLGDVIWASVVTGFIGGFGFATATLFKLIAVKTGWNTNWHSVLEQTYGFINGAGVAVAMLFLSKRLPRANDEPAERRWTDLFAIAFTLLLITWLNLSKNPERWVKAKTIPEAMAGIPTQLWFDLAYLSLAAAVIWLMITHTRRALPFIPANWLGKGQLLYLAFLWWMVVGNFERAVVSFTPQRLVTEGVVFLNALICTLLLLLTAREDGEGRTFDQKQSVDFPALIKKTVAAGVIAMVVSVAADWGIVRAIYGDTFAGFAGKHIRFGPGATAITEKPREGQPHP